MRLRLASSAASEKLVNVRSTPGRTSEVTAKSSLLPKNLDSTSAPAALTTAPSDFTSSNESVYEGLVSAGGGGGRNWLALRSANGWTKGQCVNTGCANAGGVSW